MNRKLILLLLCWNLAFARIPADLLEVGDLVFREGIGSESWLIQRLGRSPYTHIAMVTQLNPIMLIHATTNDSEDKPNRVILSSLDDFTKRGRKIAVKRLQFSKESKKKIVDSALLELDKEFILSPEENAIYCTTLLENAINKVEDFKLKKDYVSIPFFQGFYLFPKAFFNDNRSILVYEGE